jgi:hypothetical protein
MVDSSVGFRREEKLVIYRHFLRLNKGYLWRSQVSLTRGHRVSIPDFLMRDLGIFEREQLYLSLSEDCDEFPVFAKKIPGFVRVPIKDRRVARAVKSSKPDLIRYYRDLTWSEGVSLGSDGSVSSENDPGDEMAERCLSQPSTALEQDTGPSDLPSRGPVRFFAKTLRTGVTCHGPFARMFRDSSYRGRFMSPRQFHKITDKAGLGIRKGYIKEEKEKKKVKEIQFVLKTVHPGTIGLT